MELNTIVPWGRNFNEYQRMFNLSPQDLTKKILGCGDGPASFNQEMNDRGYRVTSVDPLYQFSPEQIHQRIRDCYSLVLSEVYAHRDRFIWYYFNTVEALGQQRLATMDNFLAGYDQGKEEGRYLAQSLPSLTFESHQFDLALCSHLLFLYSEQLDQQFHTASILELLRVAQEVRIFPLVDLTGTDSIHLGAIVEFLRSKNYQVKLEPVSYEFQRGANQMLVVRSSIVHLPRF
ncbi:MAG: SAM-dependent methyltransferase [Synechococcaceae cyanobacterium RL_1_2]|nr:SAM-dependent methyltransferase [Synechococcaceae cyanobacterium RL_1_2]